MSVGYKLYREVLNFAPAELSTCELVVALVIADDANDATRESWIALPELCRQTRMSPVAVRRALAKLGGRQMEFRVSHGLGRDGRPVYAAKGHATDYRVPDMTIGALDRAALNGIGDHNRAPIGSPVDNQRRSGLSPKALESVLKGARIRAPLPSDPLTIPSHTSSPVVPPSVEAVIHSNGGAPRQPIELQAWLASLEARRLGRQR